MIIAHVPVLKSAIGIRSKLFFMSGNILNVLPTDMQIKPFMATLIFNRLTHLLRPLLLQKVLIIEHTLLYSLYPLIWYAISPILKDKFRSLSNPQTQYGIFACDASLYAILFERSVYLKYRNS